MKTCTKCGQQKPSTLEYFRKHSGQESGLRPDCKECQIKQWKLNYPKIAKYHRLRTRKYAIENRVKVYLASVKWREKNKESIARKRLEWKMKNLLMVRVREKYYKSYYKAIEFKVKNNLTRKQILCLFSQKSLKCAYCGKDGDIHSLTIDHIIPMSKGGENALKNVVVACMQCNIVKGDRSVEVFKKYAGL